MMGFAWTIREVLRLLANALLWTGIFSVGINFVTNGNAFRSFDTSLYIILTLFSYFGALFSALSVNRLVGHYRNRLLALIAGIVSFMLIFYSIQLVSAMLFDKVVGPNDGVIDINYIDILPPDSLP